MLGHAFVRHAFLATTGIAVACGVTGWFAVLRAQLFAGDALSHVAFLGAIAAALVGVEVRLGLFVVTLAVAAGMAGLGDRAHAEDEAIGLVFASVLGVGVLLLALLARSSAGGTGIAAVNALFGSVFALSATGALVSFAVGMGVAFAAALAWRPLLFASLEPELAGLRRVPVRGLGVGFLAALAMVTADGTQAVGALLILGLLAAPAGTAHALVADPRCGIAVSVGVALASGWGGLALSYAVPALPPSTAVIGLAVTAYATATLVAWRLR
jgi:zinc/manganese transport system permease protein